MSELDKLIKYYDDDAWRRYFSVDLAELYRSVKSLLFLREELYKNLTSNTVGNLISSSETYRAILLGGLKADVEKPFTENSLALFYRKVFGIGISEEDISKLIMRLKEGESLEEASLDINVQVEDTPVIVRLQKLHTKLELIYNNLKGTVDKPEPKNYNLKDPLAGVEALGDVLNAGKALLPLYNPLSFFIMSLYSVPKFYIKEIYQELFNEKTWQTLEKYGIRITKLLEPELRNERLREERQVIGLERGSIGHYIREVIIDLYDLFQKQVLYQFYNNIEDELNKYIKEYINILRESMILAQFNNVINAVRLRGKCLREESEACYYRVNECKGLIKMYRVCYSNYSARVSGGSIELREKSSYGLSIYSTKLNYTEFFACLAPQMFSGLAYIEPVKGKDVQEFH